MCLVSVLVKEAATSNGFPDVRNIGGASMWKNTFMYRDITQCDSNEFFVVCVVVKVMAR